MNNARNLSDKGKNTKLATDPIIPVPKPVLSPGSLKWKLWSLHLLFLPLEGNRVL